MGIVKSGANIIKATWGAISGEISKLREGGKTSSSSSSTTGGSSTTYKLDSSEVNYVLAKELYYNTRDDYKLGAWASKPVINTTVGFMGVPHFKAKDEDEDVQLFLDDFFGDNTSKMTRVHRDALREALSYVWLTWEDDELTNVLYPEAEGKGRLVFNLIPQESVKSKLFNPLNGRLEELILEEAMEWEENGSKKKCTLTQKINREGRYISCNGDLPPGMTAKEEATTYLWGFLPIVQFTNEKDSSSLNGKSELEPIEPFMKAYHDVMINAIEGSTMHSTPKLALNVEDVPNFLKYNFAITDIDKWLREGGKININGRDLLVFKKDEKAGYIEVKSATGDAMTILEFLFYCIVDASETPEFAFGTHTPSSQASVKEQMPIFIRRISRKRESFTDAWQELARMAMAMYFTVMGTKKGSYAVEIEWDLIDPRDDKDVAEALRSTVEALAKAVECDPPILDQQAAVEFLTRYIDTIGEWENDNPEIPGAQHRLSKQMRLKRLLDIDGLADREREILNNALNENGVNNNGTT